MVGRRGVVAGQSHPARVTGHDVNLRAVLLANQNAEAAGLQDRFVAVGPDQLAADLQVDEIWSNPPIRIGKPALHALLERWLPRLAPGGEAWLVVQKNLGADSLLPWIGRMLEERAPSRFTAERADSVKGFRILRVARAR